jgi:hypothetical protein
MTDEHCAKADKRTQEIVAVIINKTEWVGRRKRRMLQVVSL